MKKGAGSIKAEAGCRNGQPGIEKRRPGVEMGSRALKSGIGGKWSTWPTCVDCLVALARIPNCAKRSKANAR